MWMIPRGQTDVCEDTYSTILTVGSKQGVYVCAQYNFFNLPVSENVHNKILERKVLSNDRIITTQGSLLSSA